MWSCNIQNIFIQVLFLNSISYYLLMNYISSRKEERSLVVWKYINFYQDLVVISDFYIMSFALSFSARDYFRWSIVLLYYIGTFKALRIDGLRLLAECKSAQLSICCSSSHNIALHLLSMTKFVGILHRIVYIWNERMFYLKARTEKEKNRF